MSRVPALQGACPSSARRVLLCLLPSPTGVVSTGQRWSPLPRSKPWTWLLISEEGGQIDPSEELFFSGTLKPAVVSAAGRPPTLHPQGGRSPPPGELGKMPPSSPASSTLPAPTSSTSTGILHLGLAPGDFWKHRIVQTDCFHYDCSGFNLLALGHQDYEVLS